MGFTYDALVYDIVNERLMGTVGGEAISLWARSGGGRGSTVHPEGQPGQLNMASWNTQLQQSGSTRGGPLPPGFYVVHKPEYHPHLGLSAYLEQTMTSLLYANLAAPLGISVTKRGGFFIHNRGPKGSDGCIVPMEKFKHLMKLLKKGAPVMLHVIHPGIRSDKIPDSTPSNMA